MVRYLPLDSPFSRSSLNLLIICSLLALPAVAGVSVADLKYQQVNPVTILG